MTRKQNTPNLFIVGAAKAGTTSLYQYLKNHPSVYLSPIKEPNYFSNDINPAEFSSLYRKNTVLDLNSYFSKKPLEDLQLSFVRNEEQYKMLFEGVENEKVIGECSTSYLYSHTAAENIYKYNKNSRIIISLRNPAERTFSHYLMALRYGFTSLDFRKAIEKDMHQKEKGWGKSELFIELSQYYEQIKRFYDIFPENQIKVFLFEEINKKTGDVLSECSDFFAIEPFTVISSKIFNSASVPKYKKFNSILAQSGIKKLSKKLLTDGGKKKLKQYFFSKDELPKMNPEDKAFLNEIFIEDIKKTSVLIKKDLTHWLK
ncbi:MAG: hypothetical protein A2W91_17105 [Bacteroidetes bacterium GWF2_38_335]|nr:MAG: hypothetical protein A2W91_17105 [Bacteroidetes bacterium GWF2_38_335]OFY81404.1 MAG: hypothetical protein A2281_08080 [Bacteroidetes bacterium RIFOXYA12_FULL_38_20]HBS85528.1 hypothetical protein [Bacteroidales bacterium]